MLKRLFSGWRLFFLVGGMTFIAFAMVAFTFALLLDVAPFVSSSPENVVMSLNANLVILLILALLVGYRIFAVFRGRVKGGGGGKLHARVALLFGLVATAPSIMLVIFSVAFLHVGSGPMVWAKGGRCGQPFPVHWTRIPKRASPWARARYLRYG